MSDRRCLYCQRVFQPARYHPQQLICSQPDCQWQHRSTIITTNTAFSEWGNILYNSTIADRLVENSEIFLLGRRKPAQSSEEPSFHPL